MKKKTKHNLEIGLGVAAIAAAAGATYLYGTKSGAKKRKEIKGWMLKAKGEILENIENMKEVSEGAYHDVVESVLGKYKKLKNIDPVEVAALMAELKAHWNNIQKAATGKGKKKSSKKTKTRVKGKKRSTKKKAA